MKRTMTMKFGLTQYQFTGIKCWGRTLRSEQNLHRDELCRRVLLDDADRRVVSNDGGRQLEAGCQSEA
jgi:hypothetical protein